MRHHRDQGSEDAFGECLSDGITRQLVCAIPNAPWLKYISQLDDITQSQMKMEDGFAIPASKPGNGIDWEALQHRSIWSLSTTIT